MWPLKKKKPEITDRPVIKIPRRIVLTEAQADEAVRLYFLVCRSESLDEDNKWSKLNMNSEHPDSVKNRMLLWRYIESQIPETKEGKWELDFTTRYAHPSVVERL